MKKPTVFLLLCLGITLPALKAAEPQLLDRVVAVVNEDAITQSELDLYLRPFYHQFKSEFSGDQLMHRLSEVRTKILSQLIEDRLVYQKAKELAIDVTEEELEADLRDFKKKFKTEAEFEEALKTEGVTHTEMRDRLKRQIMVRKLHDAEVRSKIIVSPIEAQNFYNEHHTEFDEQDQVKVRSITIKKSQEARDKGLTDEAAMTKIKDLRKRILAAEDFAALSKQHSEDYQAQHGGLSDWILPGSMIPEIEDVIFKLDQGELSTIVETPMGYHLFRIEERKTAKKKDFEDVKNQIYDTLYHQKAKTRFSEWMEELKRKAYISIR